MKRIISFLLFLFFLLPATAQDKLSARMEQLHTLYKINFLYDASLRGVLDAPRQLPELPATLPLEDALRQTFEGSGISWQLRGRNVVLKAAPAQPATPRGRRVTLSGYITDATSGEPLIGAGILTGTVGTVTNEFGFYSLPLPAGSYHFRISHLGFSQQDITLDLQRDSTLSFALSGNAELAAARIVSRKDAGLQSVYPGSVEMPLGKRRTS